MQGQARPSLAVALPSLPSPSKEVSTVINSFNFEMGYYQFTKIGRGGGELRTNEGCLNSKKVENHRSSIIFAFTLHAKLLF